jgi:hypothetical protein
VRPANQKTLWHARFGHAYMGLIVKMARSDIYRNRGLKLPENLTKHDHEEDLLWESLLLVMHILHNIVLKLKANSGILTFQGEVP